MTNLCSSVKVSDLHLILWLNSTFEGSAEYEYHMSRPVSYNVACAAHMLQNRFPEPLFAKNPESQYNKTLILQDISVHSAFCQGQNTAFPNDAVTKVALTRSLCWCAMFAAKCVMTRWDEQLYLFKISDQFLRSQHDSEKDQWLNLPIIHLIA